MPHLLSYTLRRGPWDLFTAFVFLKACMILIGAV